MEDLNLFPVEFESSTKVMLVNFDSESAKTAMRIISKLREAGINSEIYPEAAKMKKQMNYANKKGVPYVLMVGENEIKVERYHIGPLGHPHGRLTQTS